MSALSPHQASNLTMLACSGLLPYQISKFHYSTLVAFTLPQLTAFSPSGISGFSTLQLLELTSHFGNQFVDIYNVSQWAQLPGSIVLSYKLLIFGDIMPSENLTNPETLTWIQLALLLTNPIPRFDGVIAKIPPSSMRGFRQDQVKILSNSNIAAILSNQASFLLADTLGVMNGSQISSFSPIAFGSLSIFAIRAIQPKLIPWITLDQLQQLNLTTIAGMTCNQISNFTRDQVNALNGHQRGSLYVKMLSCGLVSQSTNALSSTNFPYSTQQSVGNSKNGPNGGVIAGSVIGVVLGLGFVAAAIFVILKRRKKDQSYHRIPPVDFEK